MASATPRIVHRPHDGSPADAPLRMTWHDRLLDARDRLLGNESFQRFAGTFALTRPIARRRANELFDLCAGFVYSQILYACVRLKVFDHIAAQPLNANELASRLSLSPDATRLLLDAAVALKLLQMRSGDRYGLGSRGAALRGNPGVAAMVEHHAMLYADLADPIALLRGEGGARQLAAYWPYAAGESHGELTREATAPYTALMAASQPMIARQVLSAYAFANHRRLLDVGGGDGSFLAAVLRATPNLEGMLFDLPAVAEQASERFAREGLSARAVATGGSFCDAALPGGADIISLVRVVHDHDDAVVMPLLRAAHDALPAGGTMLIAEPMSGTPGSEAIGDAYFGFYLLAMGSGRPRTVARLTDMLEAAGFIGVALRPTAMPMLASVLTAHKR